MQPSIVNVILVGAPRSGATLVRDCLARAEGWSIGGSSGCVVRWVPEDSLRVAELAAQDADARFIFLARSPIPTLASLTIAWSSRRFTTGQELEGWWGDPWSFPLIPQWKSLIGAPLMQICAAQWAHCVDAASHDLAALPSARWTVLGFEDFLDAPESELIRVAGALGLNWHATLDDELPITATAVTPPGARTWRGAAAQLAVELETHQQQLDAVVERLRARQAGFAWREIDTDEPVAVVAQPQDSAGTQFHSTHTRSFAELLQQAHLSVAISTYKSGQFIVARAANGSVDTEFTAMERPMGIAVRGGRLAVGTSHSVASFSLHRTPAAASDALPVDGTYAPRSVVHTGDVAIHDMEFGADEQLYFVNTRFSCLCRANTRYSFEPVWRPDWITALLPEDRCHLNGLALVDGRPKYVTALSQTDSAGGWRALKGKSGVIVDVESNEIVASGLAMPHSPRWHNGKLWVLESGRGGVCTIDPATGEKTVIATLPGFTRGLAFIGPYALVGLSQVRESVFDALPITEVATERNCGVWVVDINTGETVAFLRFAGAVQEIFDVRVLPAAWPALQLAVPADGGRYLLPESLQAATQPRQ